MPTPCKNPGVPGGWTNCETHFTVVWINNQDSTFFHWRNQAIEARRSSIGLDNAITELTGYLMEEFTDEWTDLQCKVFSTETDDKLRRWGKSKRIQETMWGDFMDCALSRIDWQQIAESLLEDHTTDRDSLPANEEEVGSIWEGDYERD